MFIISNLTRRNTVAKELGQSYNQPEQVMVRIKNYVTRPSALPILTSIPAKKPWEIFWESILIRKVHPTSEAVPSDLGIWSLGSSLNINKVGNPIIK